MQWLPGHKLKSRPYEIEREIGEGGFGITYKAKNLTLDIPVVIKTPNRKLQRDGNYQKYVTNFTREAKQLAKLGLNPHPHIVRVTNLFEEDKLPCIVMDFIPGESLYDMVWSQGKISEAKAVEYIKQIGSALSVCHKAGIIHRDVHPNNILIHADNGKAILIDFGISGTTQTSRNTHSGNRSFAPWEQMAYWEKESSKTPQVDIYTLAASLYYLVTGEEPTECLARKYNNSELIEPKQLNPELSDRLNQAILKGMEVLPGDRPNSMQEWLDLLSISIDSGVQKDSTLINKKFSNATRQSDRVSATKPKNNFTPYGYVAAAVLLSIAFSPDGKTLTLASGSRNDTIVLWDIATKQEIATFTGHSDRVYSVAFSSDGKTLASGSDDNTIKLWDIATKQEIATLKGHSSFVTSVAFSPDGKTLASGSDDDTIKLWSIPPDLK